ncbi:phosphoribosyltransferase-like protein [Pectobacterium polaris]|uniref:phosphoribosyltransferase-like protein n=1 Tax=Pectobacterium polaris TaxID=2042057 RepID=UPI001F3BBC8A|nr:hypothetical protein [Pectobacterium polaris]
MKFRKTISCKNKENQPDARKLIYTQQGEKWLNQFDELDREAAKLLLNSLTLVSHTEFRRNLENLIMEASAKVDGPVGLYAIRELEKQSDEGFLSTRVIPFFEQSILSKDGKSVNSVEATSDQGSEAIVAQIIRQFSKANPNKILNHPSKEQLRFHQCDSLIFIDDYIGSGRRVYEFIDAFWRDKTIVSWLSTKHIKIQVVAYSATEKGMAQLGSLKAKPELVIYRDSPTFKTLPIKSERRDALLHLCEKYGRKALKKRKHVWWGFNKGMSSLIFEHGCPNNTPAILWATEDKNGEWIGIFPNRTIDSTTVSVFPFEIVRGDAVQTLHDVGQLRLAKSGALTRRGKLGILILVVLGLVAKGQRKRSAISYATGLNQKDCDLLLSKCIKWKFISPEIRITPQGLSELSAAKNTSISLKNPLAVGSDYYYPRQLRETTYD